MTDATEETNPQSQPTPTQEVHSLKELLCLVQPLPAKISYSNLPPTLSAAPLIHAFKRAGSESQEAVLSVSWSGFTFLSTDPDISRMWMTKGFGWQGVLGFGTLVIHNELLSLYATGKAALHDELKDDDAVSICMFVDQVVTDLADAAVGQGTAIHPDSSFTAAEGYSFIQFSIAVPCSPETWQHGFDLHTQELIAAGMLQGAMSADQILKKISDIKEASKNLPSGIPNNKLH